MSQRMARLKRFVQKHPTCYFCAAQPTTTKDHVPSRECFRNRVWPHGYEFPACQRCNGAAGKLEQVVALYLLLANHEDQGPERDRLLKLIQGVRNNNPELLPRINLGANDVRRYLRDKNLSLSSGMTHGDVPLAELPIGNRAAFELFARRLTCALYYKEVGTPLPLDHFIATAWLPFADPGSADFTAKAHELFPELTMTNRRNTDIGNQFFYRWGFHSDRTLFGYAAQFAKSFFFFGASALPELYGGTENWKPHSEDVAALAALVG